MKRCSGMGAVALLAMLWPLAASAYIGPGVGGGALAAIFGVLGSIFLALVAVIYYPIKRLVRRRKTASPATPASAAPPTRTPED